MKATWHRASFTLFGKSHEPGTVSGYLDYDLRGWFIGLGVDIDPQWRDIRFHIGPITISFIAWRLARVEFLD